MKNTEKKKEPFAFCFQKSRRISLMERLFSFLFTVSCGYAASHMLNMAMAQEGDGLIRAGVVFLALLLIGLPVAWLLSREAARARVWDRQQFREEMSRRILSNRLEVSSVGEQEQLLGQISDQVAEQYQVRIPKIIEGVCIIAGATVLMCLERPSIAVLFVLMGLIQIIPVFTYEKWTKKIYEESWDNDEIEMNWITQGVDGIRTLKSYGAERWFANRYLEINRRGIALGNKAVTTGGLENILYASIDAVLRYGSYLILGLYVLYGDMTAASLPILVVLSGYVFSSMDKLCTFFRYRATYSAALQRLEEALRQEPVTDGQNVLCVKGISKAFDEKQVLSCVNFSIEAGERVRLSGANGSGKSTLLSIVLGELTQDAGTVHTSARIAVVMQEDPALPQSADSFVNALTQQSDWHMDKFKMHLRGFHFPEELLLRPTQELSGGERKKIFLSVALSRDADLLILDEPTNHLDAESRAYLKNELASRTCAMLICTHDPDLDLAWDRTVKLEGGISNG